MLRSIQIVDVKEVLGDNDTTCRLSDAEVIPMNRGHAKYTLVIAEPIVLGLEITNSDATSDAHNVMSVAQAT